MLLFQHTYPSAIENLAADEFLLNEVNNGRYNNGICRLWESNEYFVVLGLSKKVNDDVHKATCMQNEISILKRCSGGGTILQGPGCFNYGYILPTLFSDHLNSISDTTQFVLSMVQNALSPIINTSEQQGISDLTINNIKFSGNAQRRLKRAILFHGTILYNFNLSLITKYLKEPPIQPNYRRHRHHDDFVRNIDCTQHDLINAFSAQTSNHISNTNFEIPRLFIEKVKKRSTYPI